MHTLWAPWRMEYILGEKPDHCVLCLPKPPVPENPEHPDADAARLVLHRGKHAFVIMNKFPYNTGHLMVAPYRHVMDIALLDAEEAQECMTLLQCCATVLRQCCAPQGINIGLNMGEAAGAGIRDHLHFHVVPRWNGDSSFMAVMSEVRVVPEHLAVTFSKLKPHFARLASGQTA